MTTAIFAEPTTFGDVLVKATPIVLCALAVAIPARAGLWNLGGEGQLMMGARRQRRRRAGAPDGSAPRLRRSS